MDVLPTHCAFRRDINGWHVVELGSNWLKRKYEKARTESYFTVWPIRTAAQKTPFRVALLRGDLAPSLYDVVDRLVDEGVI